MFLAANVLPRLRKSPFRRNGMPARVIHFGPDDCHRLMVLHSAGYSVEGCDSLVRLHAALSSGIATEAVLMSDGEGTSPEEAIFLARTLTTAPVILFRGTNQAYEDSACDLVVNALTPPEIWLTEVEALIQKSQTPRTAKSSPRRAPSGAYSHPLRDGRGGSNQQNGNKPRSTSAGGLPDSPFK